LNYLGEKRIADFRHEQAKDSATSRNQGACLSVRVITNLFDDPQHPPREDWVYRGHVIDCPRNRCGGNPGKSRDIELIQTFALYWRHRYSQPKLSRGTSIPNLGTLALTSAPIAHHERISIEARTHICPEIAQVHEHVAHRHAARIPA